MSVAWRPRLAVPAVLLLVLVVCEAQLENEAKLVYPRGNHWAVGHLMGKKSIDEPLDLVEQDSGGRRYLTTAVAEEFTQPSGLLQQLVTALAGLESERARKRERDTILRQQRALEQRNILEERLERDRQQASSKDFATGFKHKRPQYKLKTSTVA